MMSEQEMIQLGFVIRNSVVGTPVSDVLPKIPGVVGRTGAATRLPEPRQVPVPQMPGFAPVPLRLPRED